MAQAVRPAAGVLVVSRSTGRWLAMLRSADVHKPFTWGLPAGGLHAREGFPHAAVREMREETGYTGPVDVTPWARIGDLVAFVGWVPREFRPQLNWEHDDARWIRPFTWPTPAHPGMHALLLDGGVTLRHILDAG